MRVVPVLLLCCFLAGCAAQNGRNQKAISATAQDSTENDGSSFQKAIIIHENTEPTGIAAEYRWLERHYPGYKRTNQSLLFENGKPYDLLEFKAADGSAHAIYFDISNFYGKL